MTASLDRRVAAHALHAGYGRGLALTDVSFELQQGEILAILGPNGSGKTTLFRLVLGLLAPSQGTLEVLGAAPGLPSSLARIGATIELPSLYGHLSALENLEITAHLKDARPATRAMLLALLAEVGLEDTRDAPVATFSLGMRQRLALAEALVGEPHLLVLDEPTNGLDPEGIRWFREWIVRAVATRGLSVILSSHILTEVALVASRLLVLRNGRERFSGTVADLRGRIAVRVRTTTLDASATLLREQGFGVRRDGDDLHVDDAALRTGALARVLVDAGHELLHLAVEEPDLEARYLALMASP